MIQGTEPYAILPFHLLRSQPIIFGIDERLSPLVSVGVAQLVVIPELLVLVVAALCDIPLPVKDDWKGPAPSGGSPGGVDLAYLRRSWARLTSGRWIVTDYIEHPSDNAYAYRAPWLRQTRGVSWEIWT